MNNRGIAIVAALAVGLLVVVAAPAGAQVQSSDQAQCLTATTSSATKLVRMGIKEYGKCLKAAATASLEGCSAEDCLASDAGGKIAASLDKLRQTSLFKCQTRPDFSYQHPSLLGSIALQETVAFHDDLIGADLDAGVMPKSIDARAAACQTKVIKAANKQLLAMSSLYESCRKSLLSDEAVLSAAGFEVCLDVVNADIQGKIDAAGNGVTTALEGTCAGVDLDQVLGGACAGAADRAGCIEDRARCRACRRASNSDGIGEDCDLFDNGASDASCTGLSGRCNGRAALCERAFDEVSYPTTHNAYSNAEEDWQSPNQRYGLTRQLSEGIRSMMLDTYEFEGELVVCHGLCTLGGSVNRGRAPLVGELEKIREYLDVHPGEVLSIIFEAYISEAQTHQSFIDAGLMPYVHAQTIGQPWPSLQDLIDAGTRLIVFTDDSSAALPWHHYVWDFAWETPYSFEEPEDFVCSINRGDMDNSLYILNHFLTDVFGSSGLANQVNHDPLLVDRALQCQSESSRLPNFVTVDFYDIGDLFSAVDTLNGFGQCTQ